MAKIVRIETFKYPDVVRYFFPAIVVKDEPEQLWVYSPSGAPVFSGKDNTLYHQKSHNLTFFFPDRDYNVIIFWNENWDFRFYYVNMALPFEREEDLCSYIDLDLDVLWCTADSVLVKEGQRTDEVYIEDRDEYEARKVEYNYPPEIMERAEASLLEVLELIKDRVFPFDGSLIGWRPSEEMESLIGMLDENGLWQPTQKRR